MLTTSIISAVIVLGILVFVHELGHFILAKRLGIGVITFSLGFGPKLIGRRMGETQYQIAAVPLGGFVKLIGENPEEEVKEEDRGRSFSSAPIWKTGYDRRRRAILQLPSRRSPFLDHQLLWHSLPSRKNRRAQRGSPGSLSQIGNVMRIQACSSSVERARPAAAIRAALVFAGSSWAGASSPRTCVPAPAPGRPLRSSVRGGASPRHRRSVPAPRRLRHRISDDS